MAWDLYAVCKCGFKTKAPFGKLLHIHLDVCPNCGEDKKNWTIEKFNIEEPPIILIFIVFMGILLILFSVIGLIGYLSR